MNTNSQREESNGINSDIIQSHTIQFNMKLLFAFALIISSFTCFSQDKKQCAGITKAGTQCKHKTATTYCKVHDPASPKCGAKTKDGQPCKMAVKEPGTKCHNHKD
jgi:hypothetical protein